MYEQAQLSSSFTSPRVTYLSLSDVGWEGRVSGVEDTFPSSPFLTRTLPHGHF